MLPNSHLNSLTRNVFSYTIGQGLSLLINLIAIALAARYLGVSEFGIFNYLLAIILIITKLVDLGIAPNIFREYSINKKLELINTGILLRVVSFVLFVALYNIICFYLRYNQEEIILSNIFLLNLIISSKGFLRELLEIPFKVDLKIHLPIAVMLIDNILFLFCVWIMPYAKGGLIYFVTVYTLSNLPGFLIMLFLIKKYYAYKLVPKLSSAVSLIKNSLPLFIYVILNTIFLNIDLFLLKKLDSAYSAGIYSAAARITLPMLIIPVALIHSLFPQITNNYYKSASKNLPVIKFLFKFLFLLSFSLAAIATFKSTEIINFIFGSNYLDASNSLTILLWAQIFIFNSFIVINLLVAYNKLVNLYIFSIATLVINIILNFMLIPEYSYIGATYAKFLSTVVGFLITSVIIYNLDKTIYLFEKEVFYFAILFVGFCYLLSFLNLTFYLMTVSLLLLITVTLIKFFNPWEIKLFLKLIKKENWYGRGLFITYSE